MKCDKILICDDNISIQNKLRNSILKIVPEYTDNIHTFSTGHELLTFISQNSTDSFLIFMDIRLKDSNGIADAVTIKNKYPNVSIIFITGLTDYLSDIFEITPAYLLFKPIDDNHLNKALNAGFAELDKRDSDNIYINVVNEGTKVIDVRSILYVESRKRIINIHTPQKVYSSYMKLDELIELLPNYFISCHKSYIINSKKILSYARNSFTMNNNVIIPISRSNIDRVRTEFINGLRLQNTFQE